MKQKSKEAPKKREAAKLPTAKEVFYTPNIKFAFISAVVAFVLYVNTIGHSYVLDDAGVIIENQYVQQGVKGIGGILASDIWHFSNMNLGYYRPLSLITFAIENQFFPGNPLVSHLGNVLLYSITGFFLCFFLMNFFRNKPPLFSFVVSLLFIAHPIHTEVVANIKSRDELLAFLNLTLALYFALLAFRTEPLNKLNFGLSLLFFYLALLSKETAMSGIILLPLVFYFSSKASKADLAKRTTPFLLVVAVFQLQKYLVLGSLSAVAVKDLLNYPYTEAKLPSMFMLFAYCIKLVLVPFPLSFSYAYNQLPAAALSTPLALAGVVLAAALVYFALKDLKKKAVISFGILFFLIALIPSMLFVLLKGGILAERFLFAATLGFCVVVVQLLFRLTKSTLNDFKQLIVEAKITVPLLALLVAYSGITVSRNMDWESNASLFEHDVKVSVNSCQTHLHLGTLLIEDGIKQQNPERRRESFEQGLQELQRAIQIHPHLPLAYCEIGNAYSLIAFNNDSAVYYYNRAIMEGTTEPAAYIGLANIYAGQKKNELASYYYNEAVKANPYYTYGVKLRDDFKKQTGLDVRTFPSEVNLNNAELNDPTKNFSFYYDKGTAYGKSGDYRNAAAYLEKAVALNPSSLDALNNLSVAYGMAQEYTKSIEVLQKVTALYPTNVLAWKNLATIYDHIGEKAKAEVCLEKMKMLQSN